jgi:radical SAM superfamily enzyme YgiQ (UPF0313 family)
LDGPQGQCRLRLEKSGALMRVLLVYTNTYRSTAPPPIGLAYLAGPLQDNGHQVVILDMMFAKNPQKSFLEKIRSFKPEVIGFSIRNLDNQHMMNSSHPLPEIKKYVTCAKNEGIITVLGGTAFTTLPREMLEYMGADYGIAGQGESSLPMLVNSLKTGQVALEIPGLVRRDATGSVIANPAVISGYTNVANVDWNAINLDPYKWGIIPSASILVKTGCPYKCIFCDCKTTWGEKFIFRDIDNIVADIKQLKLLKRINNFFLVVTSFNSPLDQAKEFLSRIVKENLGIRFFSTIDPVHQCYDAEFFDLYVKAGGYFAVLGADTFSQTMLENYKKPFNIDDIYQCAALACKSGLKFGVELLFGGPGETRATVKESVVFLPKIKYSLFLYGIGIRILPDTEMYEIARREGVVANRSELLFPKYYISKDLDQVWAKRFIDKSVQKYAYRNLGMFPVLVKKFMPMAR